ncbi:MAG TPA: hypothetical protein VLJ18_05775 [Thermoanaerobaculia bacterium]|nr:hypothetical protein [Thermoanaerobaculia bacterium]
MRRLLRAIGPAFVLVAPAAFAQDSLLGADALATDSGRFRLKVEMKVNARTSTAIAFPVANTGTPSPVVLETVSPHTSAEVSNIALAAEGDLTPDILAKVVVHFLDLYNRNPTSSSDRIFVREAFLRFGRKWEALREMPGTTVYLELGKAPRFAKQITRRLESYGLWGTAVNRFEETGAEAGGSFGPHVYWRASATGGTPLYFRDPNALAGDNGTPERTVGSTVPVVYGSGIPILYDTMATDVNFSGRFQVGGGVGLRFNWGENRRDGVDLLGWYFRRDLAPYVPLHGTFYSGDLEVLEGFNNPLPFHGTEKYEYGLNLEARFGPVHLFGQGVKQSIAGLEREGYEIEASVRIALPGLFASGDQSVVNWIEPSVRVSYLDNLFDLPPGFVAPSFGWDWRKYDYGFRLGVVRGLDLTVEYSRHEATTRRGVIHPDEGLLTLRAAF